MMRFSVLLLWIVCCVGFQTSLSAAQADGYIPYAWTAGEMALAYPANWPAPVPESTAAGARLILVSSGADTASVIVVERVLPPTSRPFDLLAARLEAENIRVGAPSQTTLAGIAALEVYGNDTTQYVGIGRGTMLVDGSIVLVYGHSPVADSEELLFQYDSIVESLVLGARQIPRIPRAGGFYARLGSEQLTLEQAALGRLDLETPSQTWTYAGSAGEAISVFASDINRLETLNLRLRMTASNGQVMAENDNHNGGSFFGLFSLYDAALHDVILPADDVYTITVEVVFGEGVYAIGVRQTHSIAFDAGGVTRVSGEIDDVFSADSWTFAARAGQVFTFTMLAAELTTLDPALRLIGPSGRVLEQNDDAQDSSLGLNAQLVQVRIPVDGQYRLEATRYAGAGEGAYEIVIVVTS